jgi:hypothetical protein
MAESTATEIRRLDYFQKQRFPFLIVPYQNKNCRPPVNSSLAQGWLQNGYKLYGK